ncbi:hypothetical protein GDO78_023220 [Eleutherodactylus coqui]|uniref:Uncharacterized protein n=1 Tax=Eleutherodactylus coqui TaxID=57060 RepID=A0A8J6BM32_ELECQ|nr:hypothetical protein GDO78_023220 [Eleutherodactylus coqui]
MESLLSMLQSQRKFPSIPEASSRGGMLFDMNIFGCSLCTGIVLSVYIIFSCPVCLFSSVLVVITFYCSILSGRTCILGYRMFC